MERTPPNSHVSACEICQSSLFSASSPSLANTAFCLCLTKKEGSSPLALLPTASDGSAKLYSHILLLNLYIIIYTIWMWMSALSVSSFLWVNITLQKILCKHRLRLCFPTATVICHLDKEEIIFILICLELVIIFLL